MLLLLVDSLEEARRPRNRVLRCFLMSVSWTGWVLLMDYSYPMTGGTPAPNLVSSSLKTLSEAPSSVAVVELSRLILAALLSLSLDDYGER